MKKLQYFKTFLECIKYDTILNFTQVRITNHQEKKY